MALDRETHDPQWIIRCRACEELFVLVTRARRMIVEADAETTMVRSGPGHHLPLWCENDRPR